MILDLSCLFNKYKFLAIIETIWWIRINYTCPKRRRLWIFYGVNWDFLHIINFSTLRNIVLRNLGRRRLTYISIISEIQYNLLLLLIIDSDLSELIISFLLINIFNDFLLLIKINIILPLMVLWSQPYNIFRIFWFYFWRSTDAQLIFIRPIFHITEKYLIFLYYIKWSILVVSLFVFINSSLRHFLI